MKIGVVVVHGVGDPKPGETLEHLAAGLQSAASEGRGHFELEGPAEVHFLGDLGTGDEDILPTFSVHRRRARASASGADEPVELILDEVFWGGASRVGAGLVGILRGGFFLLFGLPHLARRASAGARAGAGLLPLRAMKRMEFVVHRILFGPVLVLNLAIAVGGLLLALAQLMQSSEEAVVPVFYAIGGVCLIAGFVVHKMRWGRLWVPFWFVATAALFAALAATGPWNLLPVPPPPDLATWQRGLLPLAGDVIAFLGGAFLVLPIMAMLATVTLAAATLRRDHDALARIHAVFTCLFLEVGLWVAAIPGLWLGTMSIAPDKYTKPWLPALYYTAVPRDGLQWVNALVVGFFAAGVWFVRRKRSRRPGGAALPRFILSPAIVWGFAATSLVTAGFILPDLWAYLTGTVQSAAAPVEDFNRAWMQSLAAGVIALFIAGGSFVYEGVRVALDLMGDVVSYLRSEPTWRERAPAEDDPRGLRQAKKGRSVRHRFMKVVENLRSREKVERLVVVSHSQGTVIALDELSAGRVDLEDDAVTLITMGSPISHLYQHYFPEDYPRWTDPTWAPLWGPLRGWLNLYRRDDFVGTTVDEPTRVPFEQQCIGNGGHTMYWKDRRALDVLLGDEWLLGARPR